MPIDRSRLAPLIAAEESRFAEANPTSRRLHAEALGHVWGGVPMHWMRLWAGPYPLYAVAARGARVTDADGHDYVDFCLGDTGALFGHAPAPVARAVAEQAARGLTFMLPTADAVQVARGLADRFGLPLWQFALSASDANRFAIRMARAATGRRRVVVFDGCYHGGLDETMVELSNGATVAAANAIGTGVDPASITRAVPFNDLAALEAALAPGDVACVLAEPALTNFGLVLPDPGFHDGARRLTRAAGALLVLDETHTICAGQGGGTRAFGLDPDIVTLGKPVAGGVPAATYGFTRAVADAVEASVAGIEGFIAGIGGTLTGAALGLAAMRAALDHVLTDEAYEGMDRQARRLAEGWAGVIVAHGLPWSVARLGARVEIRFAPCAPRNAGEARAHHDGVLDRALRLWFLNRGYLLTIFYNVALIAPATTDADIDGAIAALDGFAVALGA